MIRAILLSVTILSLLSPIPVAAETRLNGQLFGQDQRYQVTQDILGVTGTADPNATVTLYLGSQEAIVTSADEEGLWQAEIDMTQLKAGSYQVAVVSEGEGQAPKQEKLGTITKPNRLSLLAGQWPLVLIMTGLGIVLITSALRTSSKKQRR